VLRRNLHYGFNRPVHSGGIRATTPGALADDVEVAAAKVGRLGSAAVDSAVAKALVELGLSKVAVDPVLRSSSGATGPINHYV